MTRYELLHYRGDLTPYIRPGQLLGYDEVGRPYAVLDAEVGYHCPHGTDHPRCQVRTTVHLQYAPPEQITAAA